MENYDPKQIEAKWQAKWESDGFVKIDKDGQDKPKYYVLDMFPYPSGTGLHMGHTESYTASDVVYRFKRMQGFNVLHPQGFDSFGLPAENFAIKTGIHPAETTQKNMENYIRQMKSLGFAYDFSQQAVTSNPEYYKWTQWIFGEFFKNNLVYKKTTKTNWCPSCLTVLANEQVVDGKCERCGTTVVQKDVPSWFFKITDFAEELIVDLDKVDWPEYTKKNQRNWIGKSEGAEFDFAVENSTEKIRVFTTRLDTVFGVTYVVVAPEHKIISNLESQVSNIDEVREYIEKAKNKTELDRMEAKEKTGVALNGIQAINPFNSETVPVFVADYVLGNYGTGAVMAVPAHDERDFEFAKKYDLPIKQSVVSDYEGYKISVKTLEALKEIYDEAAKRDLRFWILGGLACAFYAGIIYRKHDDIDLIAENEEDRAKLAEMLKDIGFEKIGEKKLTDKLTNFIYKKGDVELDLGPNEGEFGLADDFEDSVKSLGKYKARVLSKRFVKNFKEYQLKNRTKEKDKIDWSYLTDKVFTDDGFLTDAGEFTGVTSQEAREKMTAWLKEKGLGKKVVNYRLRDWSISRQRYWGCPIPIVYSPEGVAQAIPVEHLPWTLPTDVDFHPTGVSPLAKSEELKQRVEKIFGAGFTAEYDTMDTFVDSSWYFLRYPDVHNDKEFCSSERLKKWLPVDLYIGGAEHTYMHLLFARFFVKAMQRIGLVDFGEPFLQLRHQGMVLDKAGKKMSKSKGNVINPDDMVEKFGADSVRTYMLFAAPLEDAVMWNEDNIVGVYRFLGKVWKLQDKINEASDKKIKSLLHKTIKKVTDDTAALYFNTAVSAMMIFVNEAEKSGIARDDYAEFLKILAPFAPHIAEEIWEKLGANESIFSQSWSQYDPEMIKDETIKLVVQVNGKVRETLEVDAEISEVKAKELALQSEKVKAFVGGKEIKKTIFVPKKLINIVI